MRFSYISFMFLLLAAKRCLASVENHLEQLSIVNSTSGEYAYVTLLCDPAEEEQTEYIRMLLVLKESIRQFDQDHDIVAMVYGDVKEEQWELLDDEGFKIILVDDVGSQVSDPEPLRVPDRVSSCYRAKLNALQLTQYSRIVFLDNDILVKQDLRSLFDSEGLVAYEGLESPLNAGLFSVEPSIDAFNDIQRIASSDDFNPQLGWLSYGPFPHWKLEGHTSDWSFWCAHADQGLLYFYYDKVLKQATILRMEDATNLVTHFTGWSKPMLHKRIEFTRADVEHHNDSHAEWYSLWNGVRSRLRTTVVDDERKETTSSAEALKANLRRVLSIDPYCDPYDDVSLMLFDADSNLPLMPLEGIINACDAPALSIVAMPPCKEKVKFKLYDTFAEMVMKNTEGVPPMSLGGDDGDDLHPVPTLHEAGSYTLVVNPKPGPKVKFEFDVVGC